MNSSEVDAVLRLSLRAAGRSPRGAEVSEPREGRHQLGVTGLGSLLEIRGLETLLGCGSLGGVVPEQMDITRDIEYGDSHEQEV